MIRPLAFILLLAASAFAKPNILFIITDDLGYGDLGCYGQKHFKTPVLDGLAKNGLRFTDHYSGTTVCAPSRCALMTGRDTGHASIRGNGAFTLLPDPQDPTIASMLKSAGYRTAMIGKSCVTGNTQDPKVVLNKGFDVFYGTTSHVDGHWRYPEFIYDQAEKVTLKGNSLHDGDQYDAELYTKRAEKFIAETEGPFFLLLSYPIPHASVLAPKGGEADIPNDVDYMPKKFHYSQVKGVKGNYGGMVMAIDDYVGRLMKALESKGVSDDTLILFTSDNGSHFEGGYKAQMLDSNAPLRGGKRDLYEGGIRVPLIAHWPNGIKTPGEPSHPSAFWDFMPTACELAGIEVPAGIEGISYAPTLTGKGEQKKHEYLYWEFHEQGGRRALRVGDWKLVQYGLKPGGKFGKPQLFDLSKDIGEQNDLAAKHADRVKEMMSTMDAARVESPRFKQAGLDGL
ncbi:N-acetylgalactosamine-6-sulfatase [Haloferula helveola]|uniref:N-acetylgalactosamine-6-sulfatase n=1 Tax=Haloferula helveola TaxID=490095 RepID=A0ABM7RDL4_9BACT|nr:N-acetylgalactosamine-6-sulfatase [Haloferula helveola]